MDITKFESEYGLAPGEITRVLQEKYPKFNKVNLCLARKSKESGLQLTPSAVKYLKARYEQPMARTPTKTATIKIPRELYNSLKANNIDITDALEKLGPSI